MTFAQLKVIQDRVIAQIEKIRETKGREYATDQDTLADFKEVAARRGITPLQCWGTYVDKHLRAIDTAVREEGRIKSESLESRVVDVIVYHILLLGLVVDLTHAREELEFRTGTGTLGRVPEGTMVS